MGENIVEVNLDVVRSSDNRHQMRMTRADGPEHYHAEMLDPKSLVILESNLCGEIKPRPLDTGENRWVAIIDNPVLEFTVAHYLGYPPGLKGEADKRTLLPRAKVLVIEQVGTNVFLFRFTKAGKYAGDTWHQSIEEAKKQAEFEYGVTSDVWHLVPATVKNVVKFALNL